MTLKLIFISYYPIQKGYKNDISNQISRIIHHKLIIPRFFKLNTNRYEQMEILFTLIIIFSYTCYLH